MGAAHASTTCTTAGQRTIRNESVLRDGTQVFKLSGKCLLLTEPSHWPEVDTFILILQMVKLKEVAHLSQTPAPPNCRGKTVLFLLGLKWTHQLSQMQSSVMPIPRHLNKTGFRTARLQHLTLFAGLSEVGSLALMKARFQPPAIGDTCRCSSQSRDLERKPKHS